MSAEYLQLSEDYCFELLVALEVDTGSVEDDKVENSIVVVVGILARWLIRLKCLVLLLVIITPPG